MIQLRRLRLADLDAVLAITEASPEAAHWSPQAYAALVADPARGSGWVAERDGVVLGFACYRTTDDEAELLNLAVLPSYRRQGVGTRLVEQVLQEVAEAGARRIFLEVRDTNRCALRLYERQGFQLSGCRPRYYINPPADALTLSKQLAEPAGLPS